MAEIATNLGSRQFGEALARRGMTQDAAERLIEVSSGFVGRLLRGERLPGRVTSLNIHREFGIDPAAWDVPDASDSGSGDAASTAKRTGTEG